MLQILTHLKVKHGSRAPWALLPTGPEMSLHRRSRVPSLGGSSGR